VMSEKSEGAPTPLDPWPVGVAVVGVLVTRPA
jgi:hypothetical protein